jgi:hypothetical protein
LVYAHDLASFLSGDFKMLSMEGARWKLAKDGKLSTLEGDDREVG